MSGLKRVVLLLLLGVSFVALPAQPALACSCVPPDPPDTAKDASAAVFVGEVVKIEAPSGIMVSSADPARVTFNVSKVWKGPAEPTLQVNTALASASCGYEFVEGGQYLVYAGGDATKLSVSLCSRTTTLDQAAADLEVLGEGQAPSSAAATPGESDMVSTLLSPPVLLLGLAGILMLAAAMIALKKNAM